MKLLAVIVLGVLMLFAGFVDIASAQRIEKVAILIPFSVETNYMSLAGYVAKFSAAESPDRIVDGIRWRTSVLSALKGRCDDPELEPGVD